jgi:intein/homing endonuclease
MVRIQSRKRRSTKSDVETIECTVDHLIWTTNREWVNAGSISPKDKLLTTSGQVSIVYSVEPYVMDEEYVYDITVENGLGDRCTVPVLVRPDRHPNQYRAMAVRRARYFIPQVDPFRVIRIEESPTQ